MQKSLGGIRILAITIRGTLNTGRRTGRSLPVVLAKSEGYRGRKVRTPQGSVPDNVRDADFKVRGRPVPQKRYRLGYPSLLSRWAGPPEGLFRFAWTASPAGVRVKWCGKSAPLRR
jgi:hypothetical protein